jgi:hypothetical protein
MDITPVSAQTWSTNKKIVVFSVVGAIIILSIIGTCVPSAREYSTTMVKLMMEFVKTFATM